MTAFCYLCVDIIEVTSSDIQKFGSRSERLHFHVLFPSNQQTDSLKHSNNYPSEIIYKWKIKKPNFSVWPGSNL